MKAGFVRALWGVYNNEERYLKRRGKMDEDIKLLLKNPYNEPFTTFVFGEDNYKYACDQGLSCALIDKRPIVWDMNTQQFRHKIEAFRVGMQEFDQMVFLDFDTYPVKPLPNDFWDELGKKEALQVPLRIYHRKKVFWRKQDRRKVPCASFVYIRDKGIPDELIDLWVKLKRPWSEEIVLMKHIERMMGGWKGVGEYWERFDPEYFRLNEGGFYREKFAENKYCFQHFNCHAVRRKLKAIKETGKW